MTASIKSTAKAKSKLTSIRTFASFCSAPTSARIEAPIAQNISYADFYGIFGHQVKDLTGRVDGQRNDKERCEDIHRVAHLLKANAPTTHAIFQCVEFVNRPDKETKLTDGYNRLRLLLAKAKKEEFSSILLITHPIFGTDETQIDIELDLLLKSLDGKSAVKTNADWLCAAIYSGGLITVTSKAYKLGTKANSFFKRVIGRPTERNSILAGYVTESKGAHSIMDTIFAHAEVTKKRDTYLHAGIATALFRVFDQPLAGRYTANTSALQAAVYNLCSPNSIIKVTAAQEAAQKLISEAASPAYEAALKAELGLTSKESFYTECARLLEAELRLALKKSVSKSISVVSR